MAIVVRLKSLIDCDVDFDVQENSVKRQTRKLM